MDQDSLRMSCLGDSHHGWEARVHSLEALEQHMSLAACHGGRMGSHRRKPRCSMTRLKGRAWMCCVRVASASGSRADCYDVFAKTVGVQAAPLALLLFAKSVGVAEQGVPPRCVGGLLDGAIAMHYRRGRCRLRRPSHSSSLRWRRSGCRHWMLGSVPMRCHQMMYALDRRALPGLNPKTQRLMHCTVCRQLAALL